MATVKRVGIISKPNARQAPQLVPQLIEWFRERGIEIRYDEQTAAYAGRQDGMPRHDVPDSIDFMIVLGGDGTLLSAARAIGGRDIPLFAVNLGGLGFLTAITVDELFPELERALRGEMRVALRRMLHCELWRHGARHSDYVALNDAVLTKTAIARMIEMDAYVDEQFVCAYKADGLIVATPTGSTAYSLSAGGPIVFPAVSALCLTPICPHMLTNRPVIVPDTSLIRIICQGEDDTVFLTVDGQVGVPLLCGDEVICRRSDKALHLIRPPKLMFFDVLRAKLSWGER